MKNNTKLVALSLVSLLNLIPASHAMTTDDHGQMTQDVTAAGYVTPDTFMDPLNNYGCANIGC